MITRRTLLTGLGAGVALTALGTGMRSYNNNRAVAFARNPAKLPIPPLDKGRMEKGVRIFDLALQRGQSAFLPGSKTPTLGVNGAYLGPTLALNDGEQVQMRVTNKIGEPTTLHWHRLHIPAKADGGPHQIVEPGETWSPTFKIMQKASMFWYHPHLLHKTGLHAYMGMAGAMIVRDAQSSQLDLPSTYGVDDIPIVLQDKRFARNGQLIYSSSMHDRMMGMKGNVLLVNGAIAPRFTATTSKLRLRLLNGSNARTYNIGLADNRAFEIIAGDGSLLPVPVRHKRVLLSPGERAEIIVDVADGQTANLVTYPYKTTGGGRRGMMGGGMMGMMGDDNRRFGILKIDPSKQLKTSPAIPRRLVELPVLAESSASKTRRFVLDMGMGMGMMMGGGGGGFTVNGQEMDINRIDERVKLGATEIWEISNNSPMAHPFHIHDIQFRILDRDGKPPRGQETGLKDTVLVGGGETVRVIAKFEDFADPQRPYMYHCHILEHEDAGMMGQFTVEA
ncbi:MAG: multicopper oxidase domain-containing protein [Hyphomicrobiaceae bacterium]|nr:multicopper oxidase domain-containing protein [Hyphomicrobiaceae bacterium]